MPLRQPIDKEFALNRKMAKRFYDSNLQLRMSENRLKIHEDREKKKKDLHDYEVKKEKHIQSELRS